MRYQVPQFVDIEDKIIGPFTLRQFLIYLGGVLICIPMFLLFDLALFITVAIPIMGTAVAFAHIRFYGKTFFAIIMNAVRFFMRGQTFLWQRTADLRPLAISGPEFEAFAPAHVLTIAPRTTTLATRAQQLETEGRIVTEDIADPMVAEEPA